jgi:hypothetical protein
VSKLCGKEKGKKVEFCLREITQGSKKKTYGPYLGHIEKLAKPIELKGRVIERKPVAHLKPKSSAKKGGMMKLINSLKKKFTRDSSQVNNETETEMSPVKINHNKLEEQFIKEIANSFYHNRGLMTPNKKTRIENQNKYASISKDRCKELKTIGLKLASNRTRDLIHRRMLRNN